MSSNDALSDRQMLERIKDQLERREKTTRYRNMQNTGFGFMGLAFGAAFGSRASGVSQLAWDPLTYGPLLLLLLGLLTIYWAALEFSQNYRKSFAVSGSILLVAGMLGWAISLLYLFPLITSLVQIVVGLFVSLTVLSGGILMFLAPGHISKKGHKIVATF